VHGKDLTFDRTEFHVRTGAAVTVVFVNDDATISHNLSFSLPGLGDETCKGPCSTTQSFTAPAPGTYFFACTLHATMFGNLIVDP
jgi:plastocyanin